MTTINESHTAKGYTPAAYVKSVFGQARTIESITIHHWGVFGQKHDDVVRFFESGPGTTSAHFVVSAGRIDCLVSPVDAAWHAGSAKGNATSIGIECHPEATPEDYETVAELIRFLRTAYGNLPLIPHRQWHATACPGIWDLAKLDKLAKVQAAVSPESSTVTPNTPTPTKEGKMLVITQSKGDPAIWIGDGVSRRHIPDPKTLADYQKLAAWGVLSIYKNGEIQNFPPETLGADVSSQKIEAVQAEAIAARAAALVKATK